MANPYLEIAGAADPASEQPVPVNPYLEIAGTEKPKTEKPKKVEQSYLAGLGRTALQGVSLGFGDEITAGVRSLLGEKYDEAVADERAKIKQFADENPVTAFGTELAGGFATPGLGLLTGLMKPAATIGGRIIQGSKVAGTTGAIHGFGSGEGDAIDRLPGAAAGGATGAALGAALPVAGAAVGGAVKAARDVVAPSLARARGTIDDAANELLATRLRRAGHTPQDIQDELEAGRKAAFGAGLPEGLVDTTPTLQRLGGSVYRAGNEAGEIAKEFVAGRQGGEPAKGLFGKTMRGEEPPNQYARIIDQVKRALQVKSKDFDKARATIIDEQRAAGNSDYAKAWASAEDFDLQPMIKRWGILAMDEPGKEGDIIRKALETFENKKGFPADTLQSFDKAKRSLDGMIGEADRAGNKNVVRLLTMLKHDLVNEVHAGGKNAAYAEAREAWGSKAELLNALEMGRKFIRGADDVTAADYQALTRAEKSMFRLGSADGLEQMLGNKTLGPTTDFTRDLFKPNMIERLRTILPQGKTTERMNEVVRRESRMSSTAKEVLGGSPTAQRMQDDMELGRNILAQSISTFRQTPSMINIAIDGLKYASERVFGFRDDMATALAKRLFTADRAEQDKIIQEIAKRYGSSKMGDFFDAANKALLATNQNVSGMTGGAVAERR